MSRKQSLYSEASTSALEILSDGPSITSFSHSDPCLCHRKIFDRMWGVVCTAVTTYVQGEEDSEWACSFAPDLPGLGFTQISLRDLCLWLAHQMCLKLFPS